MAQDILAAQETQQLRQKYNPDGSLLRHDQMKLLNIVNVVAEICEKHNIQWWLSSGTLLGAARHKGFIPWDDDIDIVMLRKDYKRLKRIMLNLNSDEFVLHSIKSDTEYVNVFDKFRYRKGHVRVKSRRYDYYKWAGVGIDIFTIEKTNYIASRVAAVAYKNLQHITSYIRCGWLRKPLIRLVEILCLGVLNPILRVVGLVNPKGEYHYSLGIPWARSTFYAKDIFPLTTIEFEGRRFPAPKDVDAYLTNVYGDWRKLPTEEQIRKAIHSEEYIEEIYGKEQ